MGLGSGGLWGIGWGIGAELGAVSKFGGFFWNLVG